VLDARMGQVYWAQYRWLENGHWQEIQAPALTDPAQVQLIAAPHGQTYMCGNAFEHYAMPGLGEVSATSRITAVQGPCAKAMAQLAATALAQGQGISAHQAQPLYLRNKIAYTSAERAQGLQPRSGT
jgi:tRNA threonylcarbamoyladenosine biosynthesis protein TsaB